MSIKQLNAKYFPNEDRILFRMNTVDHSEYKFWLTRRITHYILRAASQLFEKDHKQKVQEEQVRQEQAQAQTEKTEPVPKTASAERVITELVESGKQSRFGEAFESGAQFPIGVDPILVMGAKCAVIKNGKQDHFSLDLVLPGGGNVNLKLTMPIMKRVILLVEEANNQAGWGA